MPPRRPRVITTVLLLCVAPAGCEAPPPAPRPAVQAAPTVATPPAPPAPPAAPPAHAPTGMGRFADEPPAIAELRGHLNGLSLADALVQPRFRALCDDHGYPLVGNVASKAPGVAPSDYCAAIRAQEPPRKVREA